MTDLSPIRRGQLIAALLLAATLAARADDRADIDRTRIVGNRELPKVLYIVPWKKPQPEALAGKPVASVIDEALAPLDREVFRRQLSYAAQLAAPPAPTAPPAPSPRPAGDRP